MANFLNDITESTADFFNSDLNNILQSGEGIESEYQNFKKIEENSIVSDTIGIENNPKYATKSYINEYAFISYGGHYLNPKFSLKNTFRGTGDGSEAAPGLLTEEEQWKNPTAKNIIEWSNTLRQKQKQPPNVDDTVTKKDLKSDLEKTGAGSDDGVPELLRRPNSNGDTEVNTSGIGIGREGTELQGEAIKKKVNEIDSSSRTNLPPTLGLLTYEWKDFAFCKYFGRIPNNRLITLRRFKLPTLDSGAVIGRDELVKNVKAFGNDSKDYLNSDSARALTYFGEGTGNNINTFLPFNFGLSWTSQETQIGKMPGVNEGFGGYNPFSAKNIQSSVLGDLLPYGDSTTRSNRILSGFGLLQQQQNESNSGDINVRGPNADPQKSQDAQTDGEKAASGKKTPYQLAIENSPSMSPFETGWQHRIYGPINVISKTHRRSRGVKWNGDTMAIQFEYDVMQVDTLNHKLAMLDIISNLLTLTYADASFYGGDFRFLRQPTDIPIPLSLQDAIEQYATGQEVDFSALSKEYAAFVNDVIENLSESVGQYIEGFSDSKSKNELEKLLTNLEKVASNIFAKGKNEDGNTPPDEASKGKLDEDITRILKTLQTKIPSYTQNMLDVMSSVSSLIENSDTNNPNGLNAVKAIASGYLGHGYSLKSIVDKLTVITPLFTGEPIGEWHLTIGNPMNPFMMIGNLICTNCKLEFNDTLGPDDFPTQLKATITLQHGRERDKGDIESMFNLGQGRFYVNVKGEPEPWNTGFSAFDSGNDVGQKAGSQTTDNKNGVSNKEINGGENVEGQVRKTNDVEIDNNNNQGTNINILRNNNENNTNTNSYKINEDPLFNITQKI